MAGLGGIADLILGVKAGVTDQDTGGAFVVRELSGKKRELRLTGRGLPYRPFELSTSQRVNTTWLPGYAVATATILGSKEDPCTINGKWKDKFIGPAPDAKDPTGILGQARAGLQAVTSSLTGGFGPSGKSASSDPISIDGKSVSSVDEAVAAVDDICRQGQLLEVSWGSQVRHGHMTNFKKRFDNTRDVEWDMTFEWLSRGEPNAEAKIALAVTTGDVKSLLEGALDDIVGILAEVPAISAALNDVVISQLQKIASLVEGVGGAVRAVADIASLPSDSARRTVGLLNSIVGECRTTVDYIDSKPSAEWHADSPPVTQVGGTVTFLRAASDGSETGSGGADRLTMVDRVTTQDFVSRLRQLLKALRARSVESQLQIAKQVHSEVAGTFVAKDGDDLRDAAFQFYGDAFQWRPIMLFNGLSSPALSPGQVVLVPRQDTSSAEAR